MMEALNSSSNFQISLHKTQSSSHYSTNRNNFIIISSYKYLRNNPNTCKIFSNNSLAWSNFNARKNCMRGVVFRGRRRSNDNNVEASTAVPGPSSGGNSWRNWLVGMILSLVLPFASNKWGRLLAIKNQVEMAVKTVETVVETVETVAKEVAHVADEVANQLPEGGNWQNIVCNIANVAEETAKDAHLVDQFIEKVEDVEKEMVSTFVGGNETHTNTEVGVVDEISKDNNKEPQQHDDTTVEEEPQNQ